MIQQRTVDSPGLCCEVSWHYQSWSLSAEILVVLILFPVAQLQPFRSGRTLHSSPSRHGCIWHHHFCSTIEASTHDGAALVVPATCPGKQEHFTVWDLSSILFLLQQRCNATTSQVPVRTWCAAVEPSVGTDISQTLITSTIRSRAPLLPICVYRSLIL